MHDSPRIRRLHNDLKALERLMAESSVLQFRGRGNPVQHYMVEFRGSSLMRERGKVKIRDRHEVEIKLGASYPRTMPELRWLTPIYHPNISEIGMVCLGGYGTHWVPSLNLDELCGMLWDMARYHNYDIRSPYNRQAALWVSHQTTFRFPLDARPLRNLRAAMGRLPAESSAPVESGAPPAPAAAKPATGDGKSSRLGRYADFVRKFSESLQQVEAATVQRTDAPPGQIVFDMDVELRPARPRPAAPEEIVFIE